MTLFVLRCEAGEVRSGAGTDSLLTTV